MHLVVFVCLALLRGLLASSVHLYAGGGGGAAVSVTCLTILRLQCTASCSSLAHVAAANAAEQHKPQTFQLPTPLRRHLATVRLALLRGMVGAHMHESGRSGAAAAAAPAHRALAA